LATQHKVFLKDPRNNFANSAGLLDDSTASPMVGPDGDVYYGVFGNPSNGSRGFLAHFDATLTQTKVFGGFGWDSTPALVPASMVPMYTGPSSYLLFEKYNNYSAVEVSDGGDGVNQIALLDPNQIMADPHSSSNGLQVMRAVMTIPGPTPDKSFLSQQPNAVREWCINTALVDPATNSILMPSEDGKLYRWDLTTCSLTQAVTLNPQGIGEAYVPTIEGPDGTVYTIEKAHLFAVGGLAGGLAVSVSSSIPDDAVYGQAVTFTATVSADWLPGPTGSVTFKDGTTVLATVPLDDGGSASYTAGLLSAGRHFITASYSGDDTYGPGSVTLVQPVFQKTAVTVTSSANPSVFGQSVTFTAAVTVQGPTANVPEGTVRFLDAGTFLGTKALNPLGLATSDGKVTFTTSTMAVGTHWIIIVYSGDTNFIGSTSIFFTQVVIPPPPFSPNPPADGRVVITVSPPPAGNLPGPAIPGPGEAAFPGTGNPVPASGAQGSGLIKGMDIGGAAAVPALNPAAAKAAALPGPDSREAWEAAVLDQLPSDPSEG
jgi:hypothetical protein